MYVTRFGRTVKKPDIFKPEEDTKKFTDDFNENEYDSDESEVSSDVSYETEEDSSESDADSDGNLRDFVLKDEENNNDITQNGNNNDPIEDAQYSTGDSSDDD